MLTAIILAGGESSRLRPLGDKSLQRFMGHSLLERHLRLLAGAGLREMVIVTGGRNDDALRAECASLGLNATLRFVNQPEALGMGDAAARALEVIAPDAPVYLTQAHDLLSPTFHQEAIAAAGAQPDTLYIAARRVTDYFPGGYLYPTETAVADGTGPFPIQGIIEKPGAGNEPSQWVTLVAHVIPCAGELLAALETARDGDESDRYERALTKLMGAHPTMALPHLASTASLKYPWHMLDIMELLLAEINEPVIHPTVQMAEGASIRGKVIVAENVRLFPGASILGPAYIGPGTILGNNALVRDVMTGARCIIGYSTEIARTWLGDDVWFHTNYVGDSVIDSNVSFGSGTVTGNLRLDEGIIKVRVKGERISTGRNKLGQIIGSGTRVGINASLMPGIVIGRNAFVGPGIILAEDVPDGKRITIRQEHEWSDNTVQRRPEDRDAFRGKLN
jgi:UDP-N-acetylglucosamine diphosphorylase / glucose-1-phosphate thymidylyltransferase / UDP-N-acetylgalactosamine diphosphorylase / glucosamine-1-phosphate N-acetyltransferase / galactosamine-1-phosphate N-acetyltransferase